MNIWQPMDFFYALIWALLSTVIFFFDTWYEQRFEEEQPQMPPGEIKFCKVMGVILRGMGYLSAIFSGSTLILPILDALLSALIRTVIELGRKYGGFVLIIIFSVIWWKNSRPQKAIVTNPVEDIEMTRQKALDIQESVLNFMFRVLVAVSPLTPVIRPQTAQDIAILATDGASFYLDKDGNVIYHVEVEIEGEVTAEVENIIYQKTRQYALKYIPDYPMLISPDICGRAPVDILRVKNGGDRVIIDFVFTSQKSIKLVDDCLKVWIERQKRQERPRPYVDDDYGE